MDRAAAGGTNSPRHAFDEAIRPHSGLLRAHPGMTRIVKGRKGASAEADFSVTLTYPE